MGCIFCCNCKPYCGGGESKKDKKRYEENIEVMEESVQEVGGYPIEGFNNFD